MKIFLVTALVCLTVLTARPAAPSLQSLCAGTEKIVFNCSVKRTAKTVSLCASKDFAKDRGYLQYRFGMPGKIELEFPKTKANTQQQFHYSHYFRYQVDLTEISFNIDGYEYQIFDTYNGEEKQKVSEEGVNVTPPGKTKETSFVCAAKAQADYSVLQDALTNDQQ